MEAVDAELGNTFGDADAERRYEALLTFARGVLIEGAGYDPESELATLPKPAGLTSIVIVSFNALEISSGFAVACLTIASGTAAINQFFSTQIAHSMAL